MMVLESCILICSCVGMRFVLLTVRIQAVSEAAFVQLSLCCLLSWICTEYCSFQNAIYTSFPCPVTFLIFWGWTREHLPWVLVGREKFSNAIQNPIEKSIKVELHPRGPILWLPVLFFHPMIEPACFCDIVTQLALWYNQCFHSFPK